MNYDSNDLVINEHTHWIMPLLAVLLDDLPDQPEILGSDMRLFIPVGTITKLGDCSERLDVCDVIDGVLAKLSCWGVFNCAVQTSEESGDCQRAHF